MLFSIMIIIGFRGGGRALTLFRVWRVAGSGARGLSGFDAGLTAERRDEPKPENPKHPTSEDPERQNPRKPHNLQPCSDKGRKPSVQENKGPKTNFYDSKSRQVENRYKQLHAQESFNISQP